MEAVQVHQVSIQVVVLEVPRVPKLGLLPALGVCLILGVTGAARAGGSGGALVGFQPRSVPLDVVVLSSEDQKGQPRSREQLVMG